MRHSRGNFRGAFSCSKTNICKNIFVELSKGNRKLKFCIKDDGKGFEIGFKSGKFDGNGLKNMKNRALELKSNLNISSQKGQGTSISFEIPI